MKKNSIMLAVFFISIVCFFGFEINNFTLIKSRPANQEFQQKKQSSSQLGDKGIGPIKELKLGNINPELVKKGKSIFNQKCSLCHNIDDVNLAPALRGVTKKLSPVFIMNYLMNTVEMQKKDPYVKKLIQEWKKVPVMTDQHLKEKEARAVLEFLRSVEN